MLLESCICALRRVADALCSVAILAIRLHDFNLLDLLPRSDANACALAKATLVASPAQRITPPSQPPVITQVRVERATLASPRVSESSRPRSSVRVPNEPVSPTTDTSSCGVSSLSCDSTPIRSRRSASVRLERADILPDVRSDLDRATSPSFPARWASQCRALGVFDAILLEMNANCARQED